MTLEIDTSKYVERNNLIVKIESHMNRLGFNSNQKEIFYWAGTDRKTKLADMTIDELKEIEKAGEEEVARIQKSKLRRQLYT